MGAPRATSHYLRATLIGATSLAGLASPLAAAPAENTAPSRIVVRAGESCEPRRPDCSLEAALAAIAPGGTIELGPGKFEARLRLSRSVTLEGAGAGRTFLDAGGLGRPVRVEPDTEVTLRGLTITGGRLEKELERDGGGIWNMGTLVLDHSEVTGNAAVDDGGGIRNDGHLTVTDSSIHDNLATRWGGVGGGIYNPIIFRDGVLIVIRSTISGNQAGANGGGIWCENEVTVVSSTISGNSARMTGGGIRNNGKLRLRDSTIAFNSAGTEGGGLRNYGVTEISGTILAGNKAVESGQNCQGPLSSKGHNLVQDATFCLRSPGEPDNVRMEGDQVGVDPLLAPLADNGGPTPTHALGDGSPAVNAGGTGCETTDQRGTNRRADGGACDIGAYERVP